MFVPYAEFTCGAKLGAGEAKLSSKLRIHSAGVSTANIEATHAPGSAWMGDRSDPVPPSSALCPWARGRCWLEVKIRVIASW